jgi:hypothetical protein
VLERNVTLVEDADKQALADAVLVLVRDLDATNEDDLLAGRIAR